MKIKKVFLFVFGLAAVCGMLSFSVKSSENSKIDHADSVKNKLSAKENPLNASVPLSLKGILYDRPVDYKYVKPCIKAFQKYGLMPGVKLTHSVGFSKGDLLKWIETLPDSTEYTELRVYFGLYTKEFLQHYHVKNADSLVNRLTVFLVPYNNDKLATYNKAAAAKHGGATDSVAVDSFNLGNVRP